MARIPYLIFGFDVDPANPNAAAIIANVEASFPIQTGIGSLGVENTFFVEVPPAQAIAAFQGVGTYLNVKDAQFGNALRWFVQLCRSAELAGN